MPTIHGVKPGYSVRYYKHWCQIPNVDRYQVYIESEEALVGEFDMCLPANASDKEVEDAALTATRDFLKLNV